MPGRAGWLIIPDYDATMSPEQADTLRPEVLNTFSKLMHQEYSQLCLGLSQRYLRAMQGWVDFVPAATTVTITDGSTGVKQGQLYAWLRGYTWHPSSEQPERLTAPENPPGEAKFKGAMLRMSREEVLQRARKALANDMSGATRVRGWYVFIDDQKISVKWLASQLSGLPTSAFETRDAQNLLLKLGIDVACANEKISVERGSRVL